MHNRRDFCGLRLGVALRRGNGRAHRRRDRAPCFRKRQPLIELAYPAAEIGDRLAQRGDFLPLIAHHDAHLAHQPEHIELLLRRHRRGRQDWSRSAPDRLAPVRAL